MKFPSGGAGLRHTERYAFTVGAERTVSGQE